MAYDMAVVESPLSMSTLGSCFIMARMRATENVARVLLLSSGLRFRERLALPALEAVASGFGRAFAADLEADFGVNDAGFAFAAGVFFLADFGVETVSKGASSSPAYCRPGNI